MGEPQTVAVPRETLEWAIDMLNRSEDESTVVAAALANVLAAPDPRAPTSPRAPAAAESETSETMLRKLRAAGWSVAVHNDYRQDGEPHTFWLLTHPSGKWVKGEGATDDIALGECVISVRLFANDEPAPPAAAETAEREAERRRYSEEETDFFLEGATWQREQSALSGGERAEVLAVLRKARPFVAAYFVTHPSSDADVVDRELCSLAARLRSATSEAKR